MTGPISEPDALSTPDRSGAEFGRSADGFPVARIEDHVFAMVPTRNGQYFLSAAWCVPRPLSELTREDFYSYHGRIDDEPTFHARMHGQADHSRELARLARRSARMHCNTPWGPSQGDTIYAKGVISHTTAGHGGFKLSAERNRMVHPVLRRESGFYEEDAEWAIVALTFPDLFTVFERKCADETVRNCWPDAWETILRRVLAPGESMEKDRRVFELQHTNDWVVISALRSDHHPRMTEVIATRGGKRDRDVQERRFLVPSAEYNAGSFGFVIDESRHAVYDGPSSFASLTGRKAA